MEKIVKKFALNKFVISIDVIGRPKTAGNQLLLHPWLVTHRRPVAVSPDQPTCESKNPNKFILIVFITLC